MGRQRPAAGQDRSTRRHARLEVPRLLGTSTRLHQQVSGAAVMVKFKWPSLPPGLPSRLGNALGEKALAPIVCLSAYLVCPVSRRSYSGEINIPWRTDVATDGAAR